MSSMASNTSDLSALEAAAPLMLSSDLVDLRGFYASEELSDCDLALAGGVVIPCHKLVLAGASPIFRSFFSGWEAATCMVDLQTVDLQTADPAAMRLLLEFIYGKDVSIPMHLIVEFYALACDYQVAKAATHVCNSITSSISCPQVLAVLLHKAHSAGAARRGITAPLTRLAAASLTAVMQQEEFKRYPLQLLLAILYSPTGARQKVASVLAAAAWVTADANNRMQCWECDLLPVLRLDGLLSYEIDEIQKQHSHLFDLPGVGKALVTACLGQLKQATAPAPVARRRVRAKLAANSLYRSTGGPPIRLSPDRLPEAGQQPV